MRILIVSDQETSGGAAISTTNLVNGLLLSGQDEVYRLVIFHDGRVPAWRRIELWQRDTLVKKVLMRLFGKLPQGSRNRLANMRFRKVLKEIRPDVVNFHNILWGRAMGLSLEMVSIAEAYCRTYVTMHDMWTIVGFPYDLRMVPDKRILDEWTLPEEHLKGRSEAELFKERQVFFRKGRIGFIAPSNWIARELMSRYPFLEERLKVIPYGIETGIFKPAIRDDSGSLPDNKTRKIVVLASAASLSHVNKGFHVLLYALQRRDNSDIRLLLMGEDSEVRNIAFPETLEVEFLGFVSDKEQKAVVYNRADCLAFPSFADNLPNTVIESISSGTPVIAFNAGGISDLVVNGVTGWICERIDLDEYGKTFESAVQQLKQGARMRDTCRDFALKNFTLESQAMKYRDLFNNN